MSDTRLHPAGPDRGDGIRAAEYVLHLLEPGERSSFEDRLAMSGRLRAMVADWSEQFARLAGEVAEVAPPAALRERLARFAATEGRAPSGARRSSMAGGLVRGLFGGLIAAAAVVALLMVSLPRVEPPVAGGVYTAEIASDDASFLVEASYDAGARRLDLVREAGSAPPGRVLQLWLLPEGASAPLSVAILPEETEVSLDLSEEVGAGIPGGLLEISEEPPGGSPEAGPTGEVLGIGNVADAPAG